LKKEAIAQKKDGGNQTQNPIKWYRLWMTN
jgi:hypothetical protein